MYQILTGKVFAFLTVGTIASIVFSAIVPEAIYPLLTFGIAIAAGVYAIWNAPRTKQLEILIQSYNYQLESRELRLKRDEEIIDELRARLEECKEEHSAVRIELSDVHERMRLMQRELEVRKGKNGDAHGTS